MGKKQVPAIRFQGFTDAWEQRKLSEITDKVTEKNAGLQYVETFTNSAEFGIISQRDFFDHDIAKLGSLDGYYIVKDEDFVYNPRISTSAPVGPINRNKLGRTGVMSPLYTVFRPHDIDTTYLEHFFKCDYWHSFMNFNGDSGARSDRFSIRDNVFFQMPIPIPDIDEQRKIGELLTCLDHLITLHQRKYEKLLKVKKSMLEKMFPRDGADVPEIRFDGFTDAWEQRKLGELLEFHNGFNGSSEKYGRGIPLISVMDILSNDFITSENIRIKADLTEKEFQRFKVGYGDVLFQRSSENVEDAGTSNVYLDERKCAVFGGFVICGKKKAEYVPLFLKYGLTNKGVRAQITSKAQGAQHINVSQDTLQGTVILLPSQYEQEKIGNYFRYLDALITLHQRKLEKLKNIKKSLLEKMFV